MSGIRYAQPDGSQLPHLTDARLTTDKKTLILFLDNNGIHTIRRIDLRRNGAGMSSIHEESGHVMFARGVKRYPPSKGTPWVHTVRNVVGIFTASRVLIETLALFLWREEISLPQWRELEEVQPFQSLAEAAD